MRNKVRYIILSGIACLFIFSVMILNNYLNKNIVLTSSTTISNKKICWGIKKAQNHEQPDLGSSNLEILNKYDGIAIGNSEDKYVYLTFDNGYEAGYTNQILDILKTNEVKATFFITAHYLNTAQELVQRMIDEGHIVGNHTVNHKSMPEITDEEIKEEVMQLHHAIYEKFGYEMKYLRPPKGEFSEKSIIQINNLGYKHVMWSFAYVDWDEKKQPDEEKAKKTILDNLHNGEIILLHGNSKTNASILDYIIKEIKAQGYEIKSLDEFKQ